MTRSLSKQRIALLSIIMVVLMALTAIPSAAFAQSEVPGFDVEIEEGLVFSTGTQEDMNNYATPEVPAGYEDGIHYEWSIDATDLASLNKRGTFTATKGGEVTVNVQMRSGTEQGGGDGSGSGGSSGTLLATDSVDITITQAQYGFQGLNGNSMMLQTPFSVNFLSDEGRKDGKVIYSNKIQTPNPVQLSTNVSARTYVGTTPTYTNVNGYQFNYTMSAGMNNFKPATYDLYHNDIKVLDETGTTEISGANVYLVTPTGTGATSSINVIATGISSGNYILEFGPDVCGNNVDKNLGCYVQFAFTAQ